MSDSRNILMVDFLCLYTGIGMAVARCCRYGCKVRAMRDLAWLRFVGSGTLLGYTVLAPHARSSG
jgi:hypothetical protein